ncbi:MAG: spike base protein, RCAP_Rcc01079 family [Candidatus Nanopelagicaceae bacterium]
MSDKFSNYHSGLESPAERAFAITGNDSTDLTVFPRAIYVGGAGNVKVITLGGDTVTFSGVLAGTVLPVRVKRVFSTDTTATNLIGIY